MSRYARKIIGGIAVTVAVICAGNLCGCSAPKPEVGKVTEDTVEDNELSLSVKVMMFATGFISYLAVVVLVLSRIKKIPMDEALKMDE